MPTNLCKVGGLYLFPFHHLCIPAKTLGQIQLRFHLSQQFLMPTGLLQGEGSALAAAGAVSLPFGLGRLQISLYAVYRGFAALLCKSAFPNCNDGPGKRVEALGIELVPGYVAGNLFLPKVGVAF